MNEEEPNKIKIEQIPESTAMMAKMIADLYKAFKAEGLSPEEAALLSYKMVESGARQFNEMGDL